MLARIGKIRTQVVLVGAVPLAFLLLLAIFAGLMATEGERASAASRASTRILGQSNHVATEIRAADSSVTLVASGHPRTGLRAFAAAVRSADAQERTLLALVPASSPQHALAVRYVALSRQGMAFLARYLALVRAGKRAQANADAASTPVRKMSTDLRDAKNAFDQSEGAVVLAAFDTFSRRLGIYIGAVLLCGIVGVLLTLLTVGGLGWRIVRRLEMLAENTHRLGSGEPAIAIKGNDEMALLDRLLKETMRRLRDALRQKESLLEAYEREHHVASTLQQALLPHELPALAGLRIDAAYVPAAKSAEVGGDWYDVFMLSERELGIGVGDVAGHDLHAATVMGSVRQAIRIAAREDADPGCVLERVNRLLCADEEHCMVSAFFGVLDLTSGRLRYAMAGHPPPIVVSPNRKTEPLDGRGFILGINRRAEFTTYETKLGIGYGIVLYTDGVVEAERDYFGGLDKLEAAIRADAFTAGGNIAELIQRRVFRNVKPRDDSAILFVGVTALSGISEPARTRTWRLNAKDKTSAHRVKRALLWHLGEFAAPGSDFAAVEAIVGELMSNVARHTPGDAEITLAYADHAVDLHVSDRGKPFKNTGEYPPDLLAESGRGLYLVRALAEGIRVEHAPRGNRITVKLPVTVGAPLIAQAL
jgi:serine phosphatase RsbU (regulator of sigma subunit)/anti-sigma regulatory factor (Ser/Thr protein kinase)